MELIQTFKKSYFLKMSNDKHLTAQSYYKKVEYGRMK